MELVLHDSSKIRGLVKEIKDKVLTLSDVEFVGQNKHLETFQISGEQINDLSVLEIPKEALKKKGSKKQQHLKTPSRQNGDESIPISNVNTPTVAEGSGFQDDAIIFAQPAKNGSSTASELDSPKISKRKIKKIREKETKFIKNGKDNSGTWDDDVSQIKKSQDFDFVGNLALFDKETVFKDLKSKDKVTYDHRLAGHNKKEYSAKKVNYDNKEMVLNDNEDHWESVKGEKYDNEDYEEEEEEEEEDYEMSETLQEPVQKTIKGSKKLNFNNSQPASMEKKKFTILKRSEKLSDLDSSTSSLNTSEEPVRSSSTFARPPLFSPVSNESEIKFYLPSKITLSLASPIQLLDIERLSIENFGFSNQLFAENAAMGLSRLIIKNLGGSTRLSTSNHNKPPLVVFLIGNNKSGARALASARHLANRGMRVIALLLSSENEGDSSTWSKNEDIFFDAKEDFDSNLKEQLKLFLKFGGKVFYNLSTMKSKICSLDSPLEMIIDALQGYESNLSDYWGEELQHYMEIIKWTNNNHRAKVVSIDIPTGLDGGSGQYSLTSSDVANLKITVEVDDFYIKSDIVVSLAAPLIGLFHAYMLGIVDQGDWKHYLLDIGVPKKVFSSKGSLRKFNKIFFGDEWSVELLVQ